MDKLTIATGGSRTTRIWKNTNLTWDELLERLKTTTRTTETQGEYRNATKRVQDDIKDVGGFVGGRLIEGRRKAGYIGKRYLLTLDADYASADFVDEMYLFYDYTWALYSTHKHTPEHPRYRLLIPFLDLVTPTSTRRWPARWRRTSAWICLMTPPISRIV